MQIYGPALYLIVGNMAPEEGTEALAKVGILIFIIITTSTMIIKTIMIITSHCYIKALFSVLGGGLPQFNTSDLFLGRESLSYMPPDI